MAATVVTFSTVLGLLVSSIYGQCLPLSPCNYGAYGAGLAYSKCPLAAAPALSAAAPALSAAAPALSAADGGGFAVTSVSPVPPHGVSVLSENEYAGPLAVVGQLPFLGTTYLEGAVPSAGVSAVTYGCGYGDVAIRSEDFGGSVSGLGYTNGLISERSLNVLRGCSCGGLI